MNGILYSPDDCYGASRQKEKRTKMKTGGIRERQQLQEEARLKMKTIITMKSSSVNNKK